ncbi:MAG TPA: hypothetical protein VLG09_04750 [Candidatus Saccharimonadales bacterium]|nr:hypothetical protein [Candidatus Saccharimonadales bacterium]
MPTFSFSGRSTGIWSDVLFTFVEGNYRIQEINPGKATLTGAFIGLSRELENEQAWEGIKVMRRNGILYLVNTSLI